VSPEFAVLAREDEVKGIHQSPPRVAAARARDSVIARA